MLFVYLINIYCQRSLIKNLLYKIFTSSFSTIFFYQKQVSAFQSRQFSKCIKYYNSRRPVIIGLSIAAILLVAIVAIILFALRKKINCPKTIPNFLKIPSKAYGTMQSGIINPRAKSIYATKFDSVELESSGMSNDAQEQIGNRSSDTGSEEEEQNPSGGYIQPMYQERL